MRNNEGFTGIHRGTLSDAESLGLRWILLLTLLVSAHAMQSFSEYICMYLCYRQPALLQKEHLSLSLSLSLFPFHSFPPSLSKYVLTSGTIPLLGRKSRARNFPGLPEWTWMHPVSLLASERIIPLSLGTVTLGSWGQRGLTEVKFPDVCDVSS